jgi:hypothetical protein
MRRCVGRKKGSNLADRLFLYIDILGFKELVKSGGDIATLYQTIDELNVHRDRDFTCIVFSDTILVYAAEMWLGAPNQGIMWLIEFAQDLFFRLIPKDIHFRAYVTLGNFEHYKLDNLEAYYGEALIECYEREKEIKCTGVFLDAKLVLDCDIFKVTKFNDNAYYVHVMQNLDMVSLPYDDYPHPALGDNILATGMEWWIAYQLHYLKSIFGKTNDLSLSDDVRLKFKNAWEMLELRHNGLTRRLKESGFDFQKVIDLDWTEPLARIGTENGAFG